MTGPLTLLRESFQTYKEHWMLFTGIFLVPGVLSLVLSLAIGYLSAIEMEMMVRAVLIILLILALVVVGVLMGIALILAAIDTSLSVKSAYMQAMPFFWQYLLLSIIAGLAIAIGVVLLVIPGIIFFVWFAMSYYILVVEKTGAVESMKRSKALVKGRFMPTLGRLVVIVLVGIAASILVGVFGAGNGEDTRQVLVEVMNFLVSAIITPISVIYFYKLYRTLKDTRPIAATEPAV